ncbi:MAG: hypothetical protein GX962_02280 [Epulopiscium sp.]|nr:hypothetical protein [Candidatus Epulonipiscium sp.]
MPTRKIGFFDTKQEKTKEEIEYALKKVTHMLEDDLSLFNGLITCIFDKENIKKGNFSKLKSVGILFDHDLVPKKNLFTIEEGIYARIVYCGGLEGGERYYTKLLQWIDNHNFTIIGDGMALAIMDSTFTSCLEEYITEIQIPIKKT